jgi:hypothetical protein
MDYWTMNNSRPEIDAGEGGDVDAGDVADRAGAGRDGADRG